MDVLIDIPIPGLGTTNDENSPRQYFQNPSIAAAITGIHAALLKRFRIVLITIACGLEIDNDKFKKSCLDTAEVINQVEQHYSKNDTPESGVTSDPKDDVFGDAEDCSSNSYIPSDRSESDLEESVFEEGFVKHVTAEDAYADQVFFGKKREVVKKKCLTRKKVILERGKEHHMHGKEV
nr:unnamed protein product [Callosobruchus analis]